MLRSLLIAACLLAGAMTAQPSHAVKAKAVVAKQAFVGNHVGHNVGFNQHRFGFNFNRFNNFGFNGYRNFNNQFGFNNFGYGAGFAACQQQPVLLAPFAPVTAGGCFGSGYGMGVGGCGASFGSFSAGTCGAGYGAGVGTCGTAFGSGFNNFNQFGYGGFGFPFRNRFVFGHHGHGH